MQGFERGNTATGFIHTWWECELVPVVWGFLNLDAYMAVRELSPHSGHCRGPDGQTVLKAAALPASLL